MLAANQLGTIAIAAKSFERAESLLQKALDLHAGLVSDLAKMENKNSNFTSQSEDSSLSPGSMRAND